MQLYDPSILKAEAVTAMGANAVPHPAVSLMVSPNSRPYEIVISADELRAMLSECDPEPVSAPDVND